MCKGMSTMLGISASNFLSSVSNFVVGSVIHTYLSRSGSDGRLSTRMKLRARAKVERPKEVVFNRATA